MHRLSFFQAIAYKQFYYYNHMAYILYTKGYL
nr:MAG TPA_asm: hypothetical protein [Bacteriophage sp.]